MPFRIEAPAPRADLATWAQANRERIHAWWREHRALLFRGFKVATAECFQAFVHATSEGPLLEYKDRSTPRYEVTERVYVSTIYPSDQRIHPHNEGTYWNTWPLKIYFCCLTPAARGGETPIVDIRRVYERLDPEVRAAFGERQVMYVRNYHPGIGLSWQEVFQTREPAVVEEYAARNGIRVEWEGGRLRSRQVRPAVRRHPLTGEPVWFNHAAFFHATSLDPAVYRALVGSFGEEGLPFNTYFGDGSPIPADMVSHIREAYAAETQVFPWEADDVLLLDNMSFGHAREPYSGDRHVIVAMTEPQTGGAEPPRAAPPEGGAPEALA
jgi:alpha-ketoglutarate-dependent taurine dioxygenase